MKSYRDFWLSAKEQIKTFKELDDADLVFGARTRGIGHNYEVHHPLTSQQIQTIEKDKNITLPDEFRDYLLYFGAGGAGPDYGIKNIKETFKTTIFDNPFIYTEASKETGDVLDNEPIEDYDGLLYLGTAGCGTDYYIELLGKNIGTVWCSWGDGGTNSEGNLCDFYTQWLIKVETGLTRYHQLKTLGSRSKGISSIFSKLHIDEVINQMDCDFKEQKNDGSRHGPLEGQSWVHFNQTPGRVIVNDNREVISIDFSFGRSI